MTNRRGSENNECEKQSQDEIPVPNDAATHKHRIHHGLEKIPASSAARKQIARAMPQKLRLMNFTVVAFLALHGPDGKNASTDIGPAGTFWNRTSSFSQELEVKCYSVSAFKTNGRAVAK